MLVVEDLPEQAEIVAHELTNAGFVLAWSIASDLDGCRSAMEDAVDVVVVDCDTVEVDLPALMALVGELSDPPPVVSLSTDDSEEVARECLRHGASAFLHKFRLDRIGELVRGLIESRGPRRGGAIGSGFVDLRSVAEHACDLIAEISADGRFVAFMSWASNLVPDDTNEVYDTFVHDRSTGTTTRVSVDSAGQEADWGGGWPAISGGGRFVAFHSDATNLVPGDTNKRNDLFVHGPHLTLEAAPDSAAAGATVTLTTWGGWPKGLTMLVLVDVLVVVVVLVLVEVVVSAVSPKLCSSPI